MRIYHYWPVHMKCIYHVCSHFYQYKTLLLTSLAVTVGILYWLPLTYATTLFIPVFIIVTYLKNVLCNHIIKSCHDSVPNNFILYNAGPIWQIPKNLSQYAPHQVIHLIHGYSRYHIQELFSSGMKITDSIAHAALKRAHHSNIAPIYEALSSEQQARYIQLAQRKQPNLLDIAIKQNMPRSTETLYKNADKDTKAERFEKAFAVNRAIIIHADATYQHNPDAVETALKTPWKEQIIPIIRACSQAITRESFSRFYEAIKSSFTYDEDFTITKHRIKNTDSSEKLKKTLIRTYKYCRSKHVEEKRSPAILAI